MDPRGAWVSNDGLRYHKQPGPVIDMRRAVTNLNQLAAYLVEGDLGQARGQKLFKSYCAACHQVGGQGVEGRVPPLDGSPWVSGSEDRLIRIVLNGLRGPIEINGQMYNLEMPAFRVLFKDEDIASMLSFTRHRYGMGSPPITASSVARVRHETRKRQGYWTVKELMEIP